MLNGLLYCLCDNTKCFIAECKSVCLPNWSKPLSGWPFQDLIIDLPPSSCLEEVTAPTILPLWVIWCTESASYPNGDSSGSAFSIPYPPATGFAAGLGVTGLETVVFVGFGAGAGFAGASPERLARFSWAVLDTLPALSVANCLRVYSEVWGCPATIDL
jgi:hypothetical protein